MPLHCSISTDPEVVIVHGVGQVTRLDIEQYLEAIMSEGVKGHAKLLLLGRSTLVLSPADLDAVAASLVTYGAGEQPGPVAIVAGNALNLDMAVLLKQRVGSRPFSIFIDAREAMRWLGSFGLPGLAAVVARHERFAGGR